jgi:hypothetical protein
MKTETTFDWDDMIEAMVQTALDGHKWFGKGTPEEALADSLQAFSEACFDRLQELTEGDVT